MFQQYSSVTNKSSHELVYSYIFVLLLTCMYIKVAPSVAMSEAVVEYVLMFDCHNLVPMCILPP